MLTVPRLVTNPLINSSPTIGLALAVGRQDGVSYLMCHPQLQDSFVRSDVDSFADWSDADVLQVLCGTDPLHEWEYVSVSARMFLFAVIKSPEDTIFLKIALLRLWCLHLVVGTWPRRRCLPSSSSARRCIAGLCCEFYPDLVVVCTLSHHKMIRSIMRSGTAS